MKPLSDLRIIDLSRILAGPWAAQILADLGADVIKVERTGVGDDARGWGPPFVPAKAGGHHLGAAYFYAANRGKRSIVVDFERDQDVDLLRQLIAEADVVIENFKVGGLKKYGLDYASLAPSHPKLIYCSITGFGQTGPYAQRPGYDAMIQAMGGLMNLTGEPGGEPMKSAVAIADITTGLYATVAILAALHNRENSGAGAHIDMSLLDVQVGILANHAMSYLVSGHIAPRHGNAHPALVPYQVFPAADGEIMIAVGNDEQFARLCHLLGAPELGADPAYRRNQDRVVNRERLIPALKQRTIQFAKQELQTRLDAAGIPAGPINTLEEVFADPQVRHRGMRVDLPLPASASGQVPGVRTPIVMNGDPCVSDRPPPQLGEHTAEIIAEIQGSGAERRKAR